MVCLKPDGCDGLVTWLTVRQEDEVLSVKENFDEPQTLQVLTAPAYLFVRKRAIKKLLTNSS